MAKKSMVAKQKRKAKFSTREYSRCRICGRPDSRCQEGKLVRLRKEEHENDNERSYCRYAYKNP